MTLSHGGRVTNVLAPPPPALASEGIILPPRAAGQRRRRAASSCSSSTTCTCSSSNTGRVRELFKKISKSLLHDGDMFGIVSTGPSSISVQMTYDKRRLDEAIKKMTGGELQAERHHQRRRGRRRADRSALPRARRVLDASNELLQNLEKMHDRRKALVYVSDGYDFNPFQDARLGLMDPSSPFLQNSMRRDAESGGQVERQRRCRSHDRARSARSRAEFADADLARRARRGDAAGQPLERDHVHDRPARPGRPARISTSRSTRSSGHDFIRKSQDSLRVLAEETGGIAVVNQNDFDKALKRIDAETSDYYVLGYYSTNPDPTQRRRKLEVRVTRANVNVQSRKEYVLQPEMVDTPQEALPVVPTAPRQ